MALKLPLPLQIAAQIIVLCQKKLWNGRGDVGAIQSLRVIRSSLKWLDDSRGLAVDSKALFDVLKNGHLR